MKRTLTALFVFFLLNTLQAQTPTPTTAPTEPAYIRNPDFPPIHLLKVDSLHYVTRDDIKKNHRILLMYFSPECDHCKHQTRDILADFSKFKDIEIVMATFQPFEEMKSFYDYYRIADHPNIKIGRDEKYFLVPFFKMQNLPYLALYDKKGHYITHFEGNQQVDTIINGFGKAD